MSVNLLQPGSSLTIQHTNTNHAAISSDDVVVLGDQGLLGLAEEDIANNAAGSVRIDGGMVVDFPVTAHNGAANVAVALYDKVYFTDAEAFLDVDPAATLAGYALEAVASGATDTINVLIKV